MNVDYQKLAEAFKHDKDEFERLQRGEEWWRTRCLEKELEVQRAGERMNQYETQCRDLRISEARYAQAHASDRQRIASLLAENAALRVAVLRVPENPKPKRRAVKRKPSKRKK
jgi:hypothetical protein